MHLFLKTLTLVLLIFSVSSGISQQMVGLQFSNFNGVHALYANPAGIADSRFRKHTNVFTTAVMFANDYAKLELPFTFRQWIFGNVPNEFRNQQGKIDWQTDWIKENTNGSPKNLYVGIENRGPAYMNRLGKIAAFAVATRTRSSLQLNRVSESFINFGKSIVENKNLQNLPIDDNRFALNVNSYQELSFSLACVIHNKNAHYAKVGGTAKYLMGLGSGYIINNGFSMRGLGGDSVIVNNSDISVGFTKGALLNRFAGGLYNWAMPSVSDIAGGGLGWDAGFIYEYRPKKMDFLTSGNRYLWKLSAAILDLGSITYSKNGNSFRIQNDQPVIISTDSGFRQAFALSIDSGIGFTRNFARQNMNYEEGSGKISVSIPSSLNIQFDWNVIKWLYVGVNWSQAVVSRREIALRRPSALTIIPRIENRWVEFSLPLNIYNDYKNVGMGMYARVGPVFLGTDNLVKSIERNSYSGMDFYFGFSSGIGSKKRKKKG